jgi:hypothetical protein
LHTIAIATGLEGAAAEAAFVTISDMSGAVVFEGSPGPDGIVEVALGGLAGQRIRVTVETERSHRQAEIALLGGDRTSFTFT